MSSSDRKAVGYGVADRLAAIVRDESRFDRCGWCGGALTARGADRLCEGCGVAVRFERESVMGALPAGLEGAPRIGPYLCAERLGSGGFGDVHRAWDARLSRWVALKVIHRGGKADEVARFRREAQLAASLHHPNVAPVFEVGEDYLAMQLIDGTTADQARLTVPQAVAALRDIAKAVHVAHEQGILHRDLKPTNIMIDRTGRPFVLDFGLARTRETSISATGDILGTPAFMAPEQARGGAVDRRTDVYGLGATLYALLTGHSPHSGATAVAIFRKIEDEEPAAPGGDQDLATICLKALEKDPARRYPTAAAFADDLDRFRTGEAIHARPPSLAYRLRKRVARQPLLWALVAVTAVGLPAAATFGVVQLVQSKVHLQRAYDEEQRRLGGEREGRLLDRVRRRIAELAEERARDLPDDRWQGTIGELETLAAELAGIAGEGAHLRGHVWMLLGREADAVADYSKAMPMAALGRARARIALLQDKLVSAGSELGRWKASDEDVLGDLRLAVSDAPAGERRLAQLYQAFVQGEYGAVERGTSEEIARGGRTEDLLFLRGLVTAGVSDFGEALERNRGNGRAWFHRGACRLKAGDAKGAIADFDRTLKIRPRFVPALVNRALARDAAGDADGGLADLTLAIEIEPTSVAAWLNRGNLQKDPRAAVGDYDRAVALAPDRLEPILGRGMQRLAAGDAPGAREDCDRALTIDPRCVAALVNRSEALKALNDAASALADLNRALEIDPKCVQALVNRGILRRAAGDRTSALLDYDQALQIDPFFALAYANRANARLDARNLAGAATDFEKFLQLAPRHPYAPRVRQALESLRKELGE